MYFLDIAAHQVPREGNGWTRNKEEGARRKGKVRRERGPE